MNEQQLLNKILSGFGINAVCVDAKHLDNYDIYYLQLAVGCKIRSLETISRELQLAMRMPSAPVFMPDFSSGNVRMVVAKQVGSTLPLSKVLKSKRNPDDFVSQVGTDIFGNLLEIDITKAPHLLVTGTTGSGKSVFLNVLAANIIAMGDKALLSVSDPKVVEFEALRGNEVDVYNSYSETVLKLEMLVELMEDTYRRLAQDGYKDVSEVPAEVRPNRNFMMIDEIADLVAQDKSGKLTKHICILAAKARAAGIHLIVATQRPSVDVVSGLIKANFPVRVTFRVASAVDSRVVIDMNGAQNLMPRGDGMLYGYGNESIVRFKSAFVSPDDVMKFRPRRLSLVV